MAETKAPQPYLCGFCGVGRHERCPGGQADNPERAWRPCRCAEAGHGRTGTHGEVTDACAADNHGRCYAGRTVDGTWTPCGCSCHHETDADPTDPLTGALATAVGNARDAAHAVDAAALTAAVTVLSADDALRVLAKLRGAILDLQRVADAVSRHAYDVAEHGHAAVDGVGPVWVGRGRDGVTWQGREALDTYLAAKMESVGGEAVDPDTVLDWVLEVLPLYESTALRVTPLRAAGIPVDEYRTSRPGKIRVDVLPQ